MPNERDEAGGPAEHRAFRHHAAVVQHQQHADQAEREAEPLPAAHLLAHEAVGDGRGEDRLQARDQRRDAGRHALADGDEHAAEIERRAPASRPPGCGRSRCRRGQRARTISANGGMIATTNTMRTREEGHRLDIGQPVARADEAGAPQQHEGERRGRDGEAGEVHGGPAAGEEGDGPSAAIAFPEPAWLPLPRWPCCTATGAAGHTPSCVISNKLRRSARDSR